MRYSMSEIEKADEIAIGAQELPDRYRTSEADVERAANHLWRCAVTVRCWPTGKFLLRANRLTRAPNGRFVTLRKLLRAAIFRPPARRLGINPDVLVGSF